MSRAVETPVLIVGAGPVGLQLALDLGWRGQSCMLVDKEDGTPVIHPRAALISPRTMEFCRRWQITDQVRAAGFPDDFDMSIVYCTALRGHTIARQEYGTFADQEPVPFSPENKYRCPQPMFDPVLVREIGRYPAVDLRYRTRVDSLVQHEDHVAATLTDLSENVQYEVRAKFVVACDGSGSPIGKALGIEYDGNAALSYSVNAVMSVPNLSKLHDQGEAERYLFLDGSGTWANMTVVDGRNLWRFTIVGSEAKMDLKTLDVAADVRRAFGTDEIEFDILSIAPWRRSEQIARRYRSGRVLLAGDAAHTMSPTGGHGMNTGAGDAVDLGWKLAGVLDGWADEAILDSYEDERRPVAIRNAAASSTNFSVWKAAKSSPAIMEDSPAGALARRQLGSQLIEALTVEWEAWGIQLGYRYDESPIVISDGTQALPDHPSHYVQSARPGSRAPHVWLSDGRSTLDLFGRGFVLLCFNAELDTSGMAASADKLGLPLEIIRLDMGLREAFEADLVLVRPDGHVAWRSNTSPDDPGAILDIVRGARVRAETSDR